MNHVRATNRRWRSFRQTKEADFAGLYQIGHRAHGVFDWRLRINAMLVVQIDDIDAESLEGSVARSLHVFRPTAHGPERRIVLFADIAELGGEKDTVALAANSFANELLIVANAVHIRGVEKVDAKFDRAMDGRGRPGIVSLAVELAHAHAAKAHARHHCSLRSQLHLFHCPRKVSRRSCDGYRRTARALRNQGSVVGLLSGDANSCSTRLGMEINATPTAPSDRP